MACSVCLESKPKLIECPSCSAKACSSCQTQFGSPRCMSCSSALSERFFKQQGHASLGKTLVRPAEENLFWDREKERLPMTQELVDWENAVLELSKNLRFGFRVEFPPKPRISMSSLLSQVFPCPATDCRGFVMPSEKSCGSCKKNVCMTCRSFLANPHTCDAEVLKSLAFLATDSKPCPKCAALIFRIAGCNHMFCTNCRTHFDWATAAILGNSTNAHYRDTPRFSENVATLEVVPAKETQTLCYDVMTNAVSVGQALPSPTLERYLWTELKMIRSYLRLKLDPLRLAEAHDQALIKIRMQFLRGVSEAQCKRKVWLLEKQYEKLLDESNLLTQFLIETQKMQRLVARGVEVWSHFQSLISFFNERLAELESKVSLKVYDGPLFNLE
jgi:hypothetical protein